MRVDVLASGQTGEEQLKVSTVSGEHGLVMHLSTTESVFIVDVPQDEVHTLRVEFINDGTASTGNDKNARVINVTVDGVTYATTHPDVYSTGTWQNGVGCAPGYLQSEWLHCAGFFDFAEVIPPFGSGPVDPPPDDLAEWMADMEQRWQDMSAQLTAINGELDAAVARIVDLEATRAKVREA